MGHGRERNPIADNVHPLIRQLCEHIAMSGETDTELQERVGYSGETLKRWRLGKSCPHLIPFCDFAEAVGLELVLRPLVVCEDEEVAAPSFRRGEHGCFLSKVRLGSTTLC